MYLIPPMDDDPPPEFVAFVACHLDALRKETDRLVGGNPVGGHLYMDVLADVAGHWRRLCWWSRLAGHDTKTDYLRKRLTARTRQWRDDQIYQVDVRVLQPPMWAPAVAPASLALRKAAVLPGTVRSGTMPSADACIAWVHAYRKQEWHRVGRLIATGILLITAMIQSMSWLSNGY